MTFVRRVRTEAQRLGTLIDELLALSRTSRAGFQPCALDLSEIAAATAVRVSETRPESCVQFSCQTGLHGNGDRTLIELVLFNLLDNAWNFSSKTENPCVTFGLEESPQGPALFVRDNGAGFDMRHVGHLFGAFQRMHTQAEFPGTGIGLATVQRIIQRHGGRVWAESTPGKDTNFPFTLALTQKE